MKPISLGKWMVLGPLFLPVAEIGVFLLAARWLGWGTALFLLLGTSLLGAAILWYVGRVVIGRFLSLLAERNTAAIDVGSAGLMTVLGGVLLVLPGFITDAIGLILVIPPARRWVAGHFIRPRAETGPRGVIDLETTEWRQIPDPQLPKKDHRP